MYFWNHAFSNPQKVAKFAYFVIRKISKLVDLKCYQYILNLPFRMKTAQTPLWNYNEVIRDVLLTKLYNIIKQTYIWT